MPFDPAQTRSLKLRDQTDRLVALGYPALAGLDESGFRALVAPLEDAAATVPDDGDVPFVLVVTRDLVRPEDTVPLLHLAGSAKPGKVDRNHAEGDLATYHPIENLGVPTAPVYLLTGVQRGEEFCGVRPEEALPVTRSRGRSLGRQPARLAGRRIGRGSSGLTSERAGRCPHAWSRPWRTRRPRPGWQWRAA